MYMYCSIVKCCSILQLAVVPEYNIFLGLSDGEVFFADLEVFQIRGSVSRTKGVTYFAVDWQKLRGISVVHMCTYVYVLYSCTRVSWYMYMYAILFFFKFV